jgi:hypothetical protein
MIRRIFNIVALVTFLILAIVFWATRNTRPTRVWHGADYFLDGTDGDIELLRGAGSGYQRVFVVPMTVMYALAGLPALWIVLWFARLQMGYAEGRRREAALRAGRCAACGYDLRATPDRCPECGKIPPPRKPRPPTRRQIIIHGLEDRRG